MSTTLEVRLPVTDYRSHKIPGHSFNGASSRIGSAYVCVAKIPDELRDWMDVNPRKPETKASSAKEQQELTGRVARRIIDTLENDPGEMAVKNQGIYLLVDSAESQKASGGQEHLTLKFTDSNRHGIVNGGHTFFAIRQVLANNGHDLSDAYVRLHIMQNIDPDEILELADGLNRAMQVKDKSLDELQGLFQPVKAALDGHRGCDQIIYAEGDPGVVDVEELLIRVSMLDKSAYPDERKHPNGLFGAKKGILTKYEGAFERIPETKPAQHQIKADSAYARLLPKTHDIMVLWDRLYAILSSSKEPYFGQLGREKGKKGKQAKKPHPAIFAPGIEIERKITGDGLVYPIFAAFRANVDDEAWEAGEFKWKVPVDEIIKEKLEDMCLIVREEYERTGQPRKPAEVGKKPSAYRQCYQEVALYIARL